MKESAMARSKSNGRPGWKSVDELVEFFETQDMGEMWEQMPEVHFDVDLKRRKNLVTIEEDLLGELTSVAKSRRTSAIALINSWLREYMKKKHGEVNTTSQKTNKGSVKFIIYKDQHREYRWRLCGTNNRVLAHSAEGFATRLDCRRQVDQTKRTFLEASVVDETI
jgi:uncharacterized protein YegP (UPF0339 family)